MSQIVPGLLQSPVTRNEFLPAIDIAVSHLLLFCQENYAQEHVVNYHTFKYGCSGDNINQLELRICHNWPITGLKMVISNSPTFQLTGAQKGCGSRLQIHTLRCCQHRENLNPSVFEVLTRDTLPRLKSMKGKLEKILKTKKLREKEWIYFDLHSMLKMEMALCL